MQFCDSSLNKRVVSKSLYDLVDKPLFFSHFPTNDSFRMEVA